MARPIRVNAYRLKVPVPRWAIVNENLVQPAKHRSVGKSHRDGPRMATRCGKADIIGRIDASRDILLLR